MKAERESQTMKYNTAMVLLSCTYPWIQYGSHLQSMVRKGSWHLRQDRSGQEQVEEEQVRGRRNHQGRIEIRGKGT